MRRIRLASVSLLAIAALAVGLVGTSSTASAKYGMNGARYQASQPECVLEMRSVVGTPYHATDIGGMVVAEGVLTQPYMAVNVPFTPAGPNGVVLTLHLGGSQFSLTSAPDWLWD
jgi:hypothetical protein